MLISKPSFFLETHIETDYNSFVFNVIFKSFILFLIASSRIKVPPLFHYFLVVYSFKQNRIRKIDLLRFIISSPVSQYQQKMVIILMYFCLLSFFIAYFMGSIILLLFCLQSFHFLPFYYCKLPRVALWLHGKIDGQTNKQTNMPSLVLQAFTSSMCSLLVS